MKDKALRVIAVAGALVASCSSGHSSAGRPPAAAGEHDTDNTLCASPGIVCVTHARAQQWWGDNASLYRLPDPAYSETDLLAGADTHSPSDNNALLMVFAKPGVDVSGSPGRSALVTEGAVILQEQQAPRTAATPSPRPAASAPAVTRTRVTVLGGKAVLQQIPAGAAQKSPALRIVSWRIVGTHNQTIAVSLIMRANLMSQEQTLKLADELVGPPPKS